MEGQSTHYAQYGGFLDFNDRGLEIFCLIYRFYEQNTTSNEKQGQ